VVKKYQPDDDLNSTICVIIWCVWGQSASPDWWTKVLSGSHHSCPSRTQSLVRAGRAWP